MEEGREIYRETLSQSGNKLVIILKIKIQELISFNLFKDDFL